MLKRVQKVITEYDFTSTEMTIEENLGGDKHVGTICAPILFNLNVIVLPCASCLFTSVITLYELKGTLTFFGDFPSIFNTETRCTSFASSSES